MSGLTTAIELLTGDCREILPTLSAGGVDMVCTSPPYFGLRDYGTEPLIWAGRAGGVFYDQKCDGVHHWREPEPHPTRGKRGGSGPGAKYSATPQVQERIGKARFAGGGRFCKICGCWEGSLGLEPSVEMYVSHLGECFDAVWRVLRDDGTCWVVIGDSYCSAGGHSAQGASSQRQGRANVEAQNAVRSSGTHGGIRNKELLGVPWLFAFEMRRRGWYVRQEICWTKDSCMPESVRDRCTRSTETVFMFTKREKYFYDAFAIAEPAVSHHSSGNGYQREERESYRDGNEARGNDEPWQRVQNGGLRNRRNVWRVNSPGYREAHFATFPPELVELTLKAGTSEYGCCAACGAGYRRVEAKGEADREWQRASGGNVDGQYEGKSIKGHSAAGVQDASAVKARILAGMRAKTTTGWCRTCKCAGNERRPAVVLDPFAGSGTAGMVARQLGREAVLIDLKPEYQELQKARVSPVAHSARKAGQLALIDEEERGA